MANSNWTLENIHLLINQADATTISINDAYNKVGFFRRSIDIRKNGVATMPFDLRRGETEVANEQNIEEVELPLAIDVFDLIPAWATDLDMYSAAYGVFISDDELGLTGVGWVRIHPSRVTPVYDTRGELAQWRVNTAGGSKLLPIDRLLYIWQPNQTSDRGPGEPIAHAALTNAGVLKFSGEFQSNFFEQGALNPTLVSIEGFNKMPPSSQKEQRSMFRRLMGGIKRAAQIHPIDGKTTVSTLQQRLKDMAMTEINDEQKEAIAATMGVPMSLLMSNAANYATATQDDFNFYDKAINPLCVYILAKQLNRRLFNPLSFNLSYQATRLDAYQAIELQKSNTLNGMLDRNVISINEYRLSMGMPIIEEDEEELLEETEQPEIFGYHIEAGVVNRNEIRERLGFDAEPDPGGTLLKDLQAQLQVMQSAVAAGIPPEQAAQMVGLAVQFPTPSENNDVNQELKKWAKMAVKRYIEGKPEKALLFTSDIVPETLSDKIKSALATVDTVDSVKTIFQDAKNYHA
jgi:HK97 family phage portal protein